MRIQVENAKYRRTCPVCTTTYNYLPAGKDKGKEHKRGLFCSQACRHVDVVARQQAKAAKPKVLSAPRTVECATCKIAFSTRAAKKYCGPECRPIAPSYEGVSLRKVCKECGAAYMQTSTGGRALEYCGDTCRDLVDRQRRGAQRAKRKALVRSVTIEKVDPIKVFEYDHWTCMICVKPTPKEKRGTTEWDAPELDHIVPLAKGGAHSYANTQTLCRSCNLKKSDTLVPSLRDLL